MSPRLRPHQFPWSAGVGSGAAGVLLLLWCTPAAALDPFEIQVYEADLNRPRQFGLELHANYTIQGHDAPEYPGQLPPNHVARFTLEPALGLTPWLEIGAYLQSMVGPQGAEFGGVKFRGKFAVPSESTAPFFFGINVELGIVPTAVEQGGWANEFRPILGWSNGRFLVDVNPIVGYALSGPEAFRPDFEPAGKFAINTDAGFALGFEYYAGLGAFDVGFSRASDQEHLFFFTFDRVRPAGEGEPQDGSWEVNVALGRALTDATPARWITKMIVGTTF